MASYDFTHEGDVWIIEDNDTTHFYMTTDEFYADHTVRDITQEKLDLTLDILAELLIPSEVI